MSRRIFPISIFPRISPVLSRQDKEKARMQFPHPRRGFNISFVRYVYCSSVSLQSFTSACRAESGERMRILLPKPMTQLRKVGLTST